MVWSLWVLQIWAAEKLWSSLVPAKCTGDGFMKCKAGHPSRYQDHKVSRLWNLFQHILTFLYFTDKGNEPRNYRPPASGEWKMKGCFVSNAMPDSWLDRHRCQASSEGQCRPHLVLTTECHGAPHAGEICPSTGCTAARGKQVLLACGFLGSQNVEYSLRIGSWRAQEKPQGWNWLVPVGPPLPPISVPVSW